MRLLLSVFFCILFAGPAWANSLAGTWVLSAEGRTALVLAVAGDGKSAVLRKPRDAIFDDGRAISDMKAGVDERQLEAIEQGAGAITFRKASSNDGVRYLVLQLDSGHAELILSSPAGRTMPMALVRTTEQPSLPASWEDRPYFIDSRWPDNAEMEKIFTEDQADRANPARIDWSVVNVRDKARRARTRQLLDQGKLRSGQDLYAAAFIFQHGDQAEDFLLAHSLALAATSRGYPVAAWIGAATLDRYLQKIGQRQIFGTQFFAKKGEKATQGDYDRALVPDSLRTALGVPVLAEQEQQRKEWEARMNAKP